MQTMLITALGLQVLAFAIIVFFIRRLLLNDTMRAIDKIRQVEAEVARKEESVRRQIDEHEREFARRQEHLEAELEKKREASEQDLARMQEKIVSDARQQGQAILEQARKSEAKIREELARDVQSQAVGFAGEMLELVISDRVNADLNRAFVSELIDALKEVDSESLHVETSDASFVASHPLDPAQREQLQRVLAEKFELEMEVAEQVDPELLAGLVLKLGTLEIDGSLRSRLAEAATQVKKTAAASM